jgi:hypothetical protein
MKGIYGIEFISPLQGLYSWHQMRWTLSIAKVFRAFSALNLKNIIALKGLNIKEQDIVLCTNII